MLHVLGSHLFNVPKTGWPLDREFRTKSGIISEFLLIEKKPGINSVCNREKYNFSATLFFTVKPLGNYRENTFL